MSTVEEAVEAAAQARYQAHSEVATGRPPWAEASAWMQGLYRSEVRTAVEAAWSVFEGQLDAESVLHKQVSSALAGALRSLGAELRKVKAPVPATAGDPW